MPLLLNDSEIRKNLFAFAAPTVLNDPSFPWHLYKQEATAAWPQSSQALAIDVFGTLKRLSEPGRILDALAQEWGLPAGGGWELGLERSVPKELLGEPTATQVDATAEGERSLILFECKFTEPDGGCCSQTRALWKNSRNRGKVQCDGNYSEQLNPVYNVSSRCALSGKSIRYWELVPEVLSVRNDIDYLPCPFRDGEFQWMRNLVACRALAKEAGKEGAFVIVYADGPFPMAKKVCSQRWRDFVSLTRGKQVPLRHISYQELIRKATAAATPGDAAVLKELAVWVEGKVKIGGSRAC